MKKIYRATSAEDTVWDEIESTADIPASWFETKESALESFKPAKGEGAAKPKADKPAKGEGAN